MSDVLRRWAAQAEALCWERPWESVYAGEGAEGRWFPGGELNAAVNCLDRHLPQRFAQVAIHWEGEPGDRRTISYGDLHAEVCALAQALAGLGVRAGDRVALYMGWLPETVTTMLACARLGAVHLLIPSALPAEALADRLTEARPKLLVTQDAAWRHGVLLPLKARADEALAAVGCVEHTIVIRRAGLDVSWYEGDLWYQDLLESQVRGDGPAGKAAEALPSDHPLFVIHLANRHGHSTDVVHGTGGFLTYVSTLHRRGLTLSPDDVYWCAVEIAWAGQTHGVYGPLLCGATTVMFEGMLDTPNHTRTWEIIERYQVNALVTTPSVVRNLRKWVDGVPGAAALDSLRLVVTFGERMGPPDRDWLVKEVARGRAVVADGWGQFELGGITTLTPPPQGPDSLPDLGLEIVGGDGAPVTGGTPGDLVVRNPWPGTFVTMEGHGRAAAECWEAHPGVYTTGDTAYQDRDVTLLVLGRKDPIISVSGQLVSLAEVADVLREHPFVGETEVLRIEKGNAPVMVACVVLEPGLSPGEELSRELMGHVHDTIGGLARPSAIVFVESFPPELGLEARREALTRLCASAPVDLLTVSTAQLLVAAAGLM